MRKKDLKTKRPPKQSEQSAIVDHGAVENAMAGLKIEPSTTSTTASTIDDDRCQGDTPMDVEGVNEAELASDSHTLEEDEVLQRSGTGQDEADGNGETGSNEGPFGEGDGAGLVESLADAWILVARRLWGAVGRTYESIHHSWKGVPLGYLETADMGEYFVTTVTNILPMLIEEGAVRDELIQLIKKAQRLFQAARENDLKACAEMAKEYNPEAPVSAIEVNKKAIMDIFNAANQAHDQEQCFACKSTKFHDVCGLRYNFLDRTDKHQFDTFCAKWKKRVGKDFEKGDLRKAEFDRQLEYAKLKLEVFRMAVSNINVQDKSGEDKMLRLQRDLPEETKCEDGMSPTNLHYW